MILMDHEGEILLDIAEIANEWKPSKLASALLKRGWDTDTVIDGLKRVFEIQTNAYEEGRVSPFRRSVFWKVQTHRPFWRRWFFRGKA